MTVRADDDASAGSSREDAPTAGEAIDQAVRAGFPHAIIHRKLQWPDTDASGHQHFSVFRRWAEEAEGELLESFGYADLLRRIPRVRYEAEFRQRLWLRDPVEVRLAVCAVGRTSMTYRFEMTGPQGVVADGTMIVVYTDGSVGGSMPWPDDMRTALKGKSLPER